MPRAWFVLVLCLAALSSTCGSETSPRPTGSTTSGVSQSDVDAMVGGLCEMSNELGNDVGAGRTVFYDRVHERLHALAAEAQEVDTTVAGSLLEAKQLVEADLEVDEAPPGYEEHLARLLVVTQDAVVLLGLDDPGCDG